MDAKGKCVAGGNVTRLAEKAAWLGVVRVKLFDYELAKVVQLRRAYNAAQKRLEVMVALPNWAHTETDIEKLLEVVKGNLDIVRGVMVYNEPCLSGYCTGEKGEKFLSTLERITKELTPHDIVVTPPFSMGGILKNTYPPQNSEFKDPVFMKRVVKILAMGNNPISANLYPYLDIACNPDVPLNYALGELPQANVQGTLFTSQVDADIKSLRYAIKKIEEPGEDFSNVQVQIGETGWAHSGGDQPWNKTKMRIWKLSTKDYAQKFYSNIATSLINRQWTPQNLYGIYIFDLADEPLKEGHYPAYDGEKYFGIEGLWTEEDTVHIAPWKWDKLPESTPPPQCQPLNSPVNNACAAAVEWVFQSGKHDPQAGSFYGASMGQSVKVDFMSASLNDWQKLFFCAPPNDQTKRCGAPPCQCTTPPCNVCDLAPGKTPPSDGRPAAVVPHMRPQDWDVWYSIKAQEAEAAKAEMEEKWETDFIGSSTSSSFWPSFAVTGLTAVVAAVAVVGFVGLLRRRAPKVEMRELEFALETGSAE
eukprot:TRINITY_DN49557_c0_g1_i1.p1 TRINITY_DN49557_c0_g1~~TRINITY_DN49557_c0_g1_i1.p1  ORF type:complete len:588 (-),score=134.67 TRINITY_DN49557_c0_g1_i1:57-1652(-)